MIGRTRFSDLTQVEKDTLQKRQKSAAKDIVESIEAAEVERVKIFVSFAHTTESGSTYFSNCTIENTHAPQSSKDVIELHEYIREKCDCKRAVIIGWQVMK